MRGMKVEVVAFFCAGLCLIVTTALANTLPDAGRALRDVEQLAPVKPAPPGADVQIKQQVIAPDRKAAAGLSFIIKSFHISGNYMIATKDLLPLVQDYTGDKRSLADIEQAATRITAYYHDHGYLVAYAYVPQQQITNGMVNIIVLEGRYGQVSLKNKSHTHDAVLQRFLAPDQLCAVIDANCLDRALLLIQDTAQTGAVHALLRPGAATGESDVEVTVPPLPLVTGQLEADNYGVRVTGRGRVGGSVRWHSPTGHGDRLEAKILTSGQGQDYGRLAYDLPIPTGSQGLRLGIDYTESRYRLGEEYRVLDAYGQAG